MCCRHWSGVSGAWPAQIHLVTRSGFVSHESRPPPAPDPYRVLPSDENATVVTSARPLSIASGPPSRMLQRVTVRPTPAHATMWPSGLKATLSTAPANPMRGEGSGVWEATLHSLTVPP